MDERRNHHARDENNGPFASSSADLIAAWRAAKSAPDYAAEAARQAESAAFADVEDRVMEWVEGVGAEAWDDL